MENNSRGIAAGIWCVLVAALAKIKFWSRGLERRVSVKD